MEFPDGLKYSKEHEWVLVEGNTATIGITEYAQEELGDIVYVELPEVGEKVIKDDPFGANTIFHSYCRGIWVSILLDEAELPPIGGIPQTLKARFGDAVNDLIQPRTPQNTGQLPDGEPADAPSIATPSAAQALPGRLLWRDRTFLTLAAAMAFGLFAQIGLLAHLFSLLVPPLGEQAAGILMGLATASAIAGRTLVGWLMPAGSDRRLIACASLVVQIAGSVILMLAAGSEVVLLVAGVLLFGAGIGNTTSLPPLIAQVEFTKADVQRVVPLIVAIGQGTYAFAPAAFGALRTLSPAQATWVFGAASIVQVLAIAAFLLGRRRREA